MPGLKNMYTQMFPPAPDFTEANLPDLSGKVYIVTGSNTGVGAELVQLLYGKNATVYGAARSREKNDAAIAAVKKQHPDSKGRVEHLQLDLGDLTTIKASAEAFLAKEQKLNVLFLNAGVMTPPQGSKTAQGYELQLGTNNLGHFLFTKLLTPLLETTAKTEPADSTRVVWVSSSAAELMAPSPLSSAFDENLDYKKDKSAQVKYGVSKAGNILHAHEFALRHPDIVSVSLNPGNLSSDLARHQPAIIVKLLGRFFLHPSVYGAYTELFAGLSPAVTREALKTNDWIVPWGRLWSYNADLQQAVKRKSDGGSGVGERFWSWSEEQVKQYA